MAIPARNMNVIVVSIARPTRGYGNRPEDTTAIIEDVEAHRQPGGPAKGTHLTRPATGTTETPDHIFFLNPWPTAGEVRVGDTLSWRRMDPATRKPTGSTFSGEIRRVAEHDGFFRQNIDHVALEVRGGDGSGA